MEANVANFVRQDVKIPKGNALLPVFEAVSNSLDAIGDRVGGGTVRVEIIRHPDQTDGSLGDVKDVVVSDDGVGFTDDNLQSFSQLFSDRKSSFGGKGRGRLTYLKVFERAKVDSVFKAEAGNAERIFDFDFSFDTRPAPQAKPSARKLETRVVLENMAQPYAREVPKVFETLLRRFIWHFLPKLLASTELKITLVDRDEVNLVQYLREVLQIDAKDDPFKVNGRTFKLTHVRLHPKADVKHRLIMAAAAREVDDGFRIARRIPLLGFGPLSDENLTGGFIYVALLQGDYLDEMANPLRLGFVNDGPDDAGTDEEDEDDTVDDELVRKADLFDDPVSIAQVRDEAVRRVKVFLDPYLSGAVAQRVEAIQAYIRKDGMGYHFLRPDVDAIARGLRKVDEATIERALHTKAYQEKIKRRDDAKRLLASTPKEKSEKSYFERWQGIVTSLSNVAKSELAEYVAHRRAILDLVEDLLGTAEDGRRAKEEVIHSVIFPKGTQSGQVGYEQQNLWLIDERLSFHEHLFSDKSINAVTQGEVDSLRRPDLAIFESGFASFHDGTAPPANIVLVELKRPARKDASRDDPVQATLKYVRDLKSGKAFSEGGAAIDVQKNAQTTVYILADWTKDFKEYLDDQDFKDMPGDHGRFRYHENENIMFIAFSFKRLVANAKMRNRVFFKKLGIE